MRRRVAITGLGVLTPLGNGVQSTWEGLVAGRSGAGPITRFDPVQSPVKFACEVKGFDPAQFLDKKEIRRYDLFAQYAIGAAEQAVMDACLASNWEKVDLRRVGAIIGTGTGGLQTFEENARALFEKGPSRVSPFFVPMYMPNVAAALISMRYGVKGPNYCTVSACPSSAHSVGEALALIRNDQAHIMMLDGAGAQDAMRLALRDTGGRLEQVGYINAHGTSTPHGDSAETAAVKTVFGPHARKLIFGSTKSMTGHLLGAAGAFEAALCALVVQTGVIPPTINQFTPDPACDLDSAPNKAVKRHVDVALSNSFGFGGHNVTLAIRRAA